VLESYFVANPDWAIERSPIIEMYRRGSTRKWISRSRC